MSRGKGYEAQPVGERFTEAPLSGYFIDFRAKTTAGTAATPWRLSPAALAQLSLGWWERVIAGEPNLLSHFLETAELLRRGAQFNANGALWAYDADLPKYGMRAPWYSAMAQGQIASVLLAGLPTCALVPRSACELGAAIAEALAQPRDAALRDRAALTSRPRVAEQLVALYGLVACTN